MRQQIARLRANGRHRPGAPGRQEINAVNAHGREDAAELIFHGIGQHTHHHQGRRRFGRQGGQPGNQRGQAGILTLREGGLDAAAGVIQHPDRRADAFRQPPGGTGKVQLDDFRGAGPHQEEQLDVRAPRQQAHHHIVQLFIRIGQPGEIALLDDRRREARFGEDHHPGSGLHQMRAGPRTDDQKEGILDLAVQPHDAGQAAENLALAAFPEDRRVGAAVIHRQRGRHDRGVGDRRIHDVTSRPSEVSSILSEASRRALRSFRRNCPALTT